MEFLDKPELQFTVICDDIRREDNGKLILLGLFELIAARTFPAVHPRLFIANRWCKWDGRFKEKTRIVYTETKEVIVESAEVEVELTDFSNHHTVLSQFDNVKFPGPGKYFVEVLLNNELFRYFPINLITMGQPAA